MMMMMLNIEEMWMEMDRSLDRPQERRSRSGDDMCKEGRGRVQAWDRRVSRVGNHTSFGGLTDLYPGLLQDLGLLLQLYHLALVGKHFSGALQDHLESLLTPEGILLEALNGELLDAVLDLLPSTDDGCDLGALMEDGLCVRV
jgi:hypothetical protein